MNRRNGAVQLDGSSADAERRAELEFGIPVHGEPPRPCDRAIGTMNLSESPLNRPSGTFSPTGGDLFSRVGTALHSTANRPGSQRVVRPEDIALFQSASACPRAADGDRPRSALRRTHLANQIPWGRRMG